MTEAETRSMEEKPLRPGEITIDLPTNFDAGLSEGGGYPFLTSFRRYSHEEDRWMVHERETADAGDYEISIKHAAAFQRDPIAVYGASRVLEVEDHAVLLVQGAHEITHLRTQDTLHRSLLRRHHVDLDASGA